MWKQAILWGAGLALAAVSLQWLDYLRLVRAYTNDVFIAVIAAGFLALGAWIGARVLRRPAPQAFNGNAQAQAALGISARELSVLREIANGASNKEIAARLKVSPNTVKTHIARLYEKLEARRRTDALRRARDLGLVP